MVLLNVSSFIYFVALSHPLLLRGCYCFLSIVSTVSLAPSKFDVLTLDTCIRTCYSGKLYPIAFVIQILRTTAVTFGYFPWQKPKFNDIPSGCFSVTRAPNEPLQCTDKKENQIFLIYREIQTGAVAKSYIFLTVSSYLGKYLRIS